MRFILLLSLAATALLAQPSYRVVEGWPQVPADTPLGLCAGVGVDAQNRVFVFHRCGRKWSKPFPSEPIREPVVSVFDGASGRKLASWGAGQFVMPHGLTVDHRGHVWLTDVGLHQVFECTPEGKILRTWGEAGVPGKDAAHFNLPTDVAILPDGSFYVSDGYQNTRVVKFSASGTYDFEWGTQGEGHGQFHLPHGLAVDSQGRVLVCDRENERIQIFDAKGGFIAVWKSRLIGKPYGITASSAGDIFAVDGGLPSLKPSERGKVVTLNHRGEVLEAFGSYGSAPGQFQLGHDIAMGPDGALYVAEGTGARVQKFVRQP